MPFFPLSRKQNKNPKREKRKIGRNARELEILRIAVETAVVDCFEKLRRFD